MKTMKEVEQIDAICEEQFKDLPITEAEYQGKKVKLNDPIRGGSKKFYVYVKDGDKVKKVSFGDPGPKTKARYWSCYQWRANAPVDN
jgi:hypothetical protein